MDYFFSIVWRWEAHDPALGVRIRARALPKKRDGLDWMPLSLAKPLSSRRPRKQYGNPIRKRSKAERRAGSATGVKVI